MNLDLEKENARLRSALAGAVCNGEMNAKALVEEACKKHDLEHAITNALQHLDSGRAEEARRILASAIAYDAKRRFKTR